jgi:uncharacterized membrane protein SpoIIM required for sporulation/ABC-type transport system involved in multi-copper enzyme maturation permease subunit
METSMPEKSGLNAALIQTFGQPHDWRNTFRNALVVTEREVRDSFRDWRIVAPIFILTLIFPFLANLASYAFTGLLRNSAGETFENRQEILDAFLPLMPMLVGFFPTAISLVIALESFVGEKERLSLEPLLSTPLTNTELYIGKVLASIIPPLAAAYLGIIFYVGGQVLGDQNWRPDIVLLLQVCLLTFLQAVVMVTGAVVISSQTTSTRAANLLASSVILPMSMLVIVESIIMIQPRFRFTLWWIMVGLVVVLILLLRTGTRIFNREELLGRSVDQLNLVWAWRVIVDQWFGGVTGWNPLIWYQQSVWPALVKLRQAIFFFALAAIAAFIWGWVASSTYTLPLDESSMTDETILENLRQIFELGQEDPRVMALAAFQNIRVLLVATVMASFTFGVMGVLFTALPFGIFGYVMGNIQKAGLSPWPFILAVLPHGVVEIPAIVIAGAAALQLGAILTQPPPNMTVGEAWLRQFSDTLKLGLAVILPMLILAAILEVQLTPRVVEWVLTQHSSG